MQEVMRDIRRMGGIRKLSTAEQIAWWEKLYTGPKCTYRAGVPGDFDNKNRPFTDKPKIKNGSF